MRLIDADEYLEKVCTYKKTGCGSCKLQTACPADEPVVKAIPIDWIVNWLTKQTIPSLHTCDNYEAVNMMLDDWEAENE